MILQTLPSLLQLSVAMIDGRWFHRSRNYGIISGLRILSARRHFAVRVMCHTGVGQALAHVYRIIEG
jgi:hypothetical protein